MGIYLNLAQIVMGIALILSIVLQSKEAGLGGLTGGEAGGVFRARRGVERSLFQITIVLSVLFFALAMVNVLYAG
ncbi:MAG: preprotein translocase subunit SecG [Anaerolineales bacterium]